MLSLTKGWILQGRGPGALSLQYLLGQPHCTACSLMTHSFLLMSKTLTYVLHLTWKAALILGLPVYQKRSGNKAVGSEVLHLIPNPLKLQISWKRVVWPKDQVMFLALQHEQSDSETPRNSMMLLSKVRMQMDLQSYGEEAFVGRKLSCKVW